MSPPEAKLKKLKLNSVIFNAFKLLPLLACIDTMWSTDDISDFLNGPVYTLAIFPSVIDLFVSIRASAGKSLKYFQIRAAFLFFELFFICFLLSIKFSLCFCVFFIILFALSVILNLATLKKYKKLIPPPDNKQQPNTFRRELTPIDAIISLLLMFYDLDICAFFLNFCILDNRAIFMDFNIIIIYMICYILVSMIDLNSKKIPKDKAAIVTYGSLVVALLMDCLVMIAPAISWPTNLRTACRSIPILFFALRFRYLQRLQKKSKTIPSNNDSSQSSLVSAQDDSSKTEN